MSTWNKKNKYSVEKKAEWSTRRRLRMMNQNMFIPVRPTILEIRRDKINNILNKMKNNK